MDRKDLDNVKVIEAIGLEINNPQKCYVFKVNCHPTMFSSMRDQLGIMLKEKLGTTNFLILNVDPDNLVTAL